jgi:IS5 family transposase
MAAKTRIRAKLGRDESSRAIGREIGDLAGLAVAAAVLRNRRRALPKALTGQMRGRLRRALGIWLSPSRGPYGGGPRPAPAGRANARRRHPAGWATRSRRPADTQGRTDGPVEFGHNAQVLDNDDGVVVDFSADRGAALAACSSRPP